MAFVAEAEGTCAEGNEWFVDKGSWERNAPHAPSLSLTVAVMPETGEVELVELANEWPS